MLSYGHVIHTYFCWIEQLYFVFFEDRYCWMLLRIITRLHGSVTSVVRATPHTKRGAYSIVNGDRCSVSHCNYQNRIRSVRIFANCLSVVSFNSTILVIVISAIRPPLRLNNIHQWPKTVRTLENTQNKM